ncbi:unnamed protein product [Absidia cylindrospora]
MLDDPGSTSPTYQLTALSTLRQPSTDSETPAKQALRTGLTVSRPPAKPTASSALELANQLHNTIMAQLQSLDEPLTTITPTVLQNQTQQQSSQEPVTGTLAHTALRQTSTNEHLNTNINHSSIAGVETSKGPVLGRPSISATITSDTQHTEKTLDKPSLSDEPTSPMTDTQQNTQSLQHLDQLQPWTEALEIHLDRLKLHTTPPRLLTNTTSKMKKDTAANIKVTRDNILRLWWYDAHQPYNNGTILLFGKVLDHSTNTYASCCVHVKNIKRTLFVLPRCYRYNEDETLEKKKVTMDDVKDELTQLFYRHHIRDWTCSIRKRKYAFELEDVPAESDYLKIQYSFKDPELPADINGLTYSRVFGTNNSPMELFLIKRGIKGPQWLEIKNAQPSPNETKGTWCQYEFSVSDPKQVNTIQNDLQTINLKSPPLSVMSLHLRTITNTKYNTNEIIAVGVFMCPKVMMDQVDDLENVENSRFVVVRPGGACDTQWPEDLDEAVAKERRNGLPIQIEDSEYSLLNYLCAKIHLYDPDVIIGHGFSRFTLDVLLHRIKACNIPFWHKLGRIRWKRKPQLQFGPGGTGISTPKEKALLTGRLVCDTMVACRTLIQAKSYHLSSLAETQLGIKRAEDNTILSGKASLDGKSKSTIFLAKHCWMDSYLAMALLFKFQVLPLSKKLTNIAGNLWSRSLEGSRMNRNEYLLLHEFHRMKYICPDKVRSDFHGIGLEGLVETVNDNELVEPSAYNNSKKTTKKQSSYGGGLVLEPKTGLHEKFVVLLDFNSLYPSIIQEFNICFTTVDRLKVGEDDLLSNIPDPDIPLGVLPRLMKQMVDERKQIKNRMKIPGLEESKLTQYDIEQNALKLTANSLYGSLGSGFSRFQAKHLAAMITSQGRSILRETVDTVEQQLDMDVVYGDTDSIMVATAECTMEKAQEAAKLVQTLINGKYRLLELGIDGYFRRLLILGKKNYASLTLTRQENEPNSWVGSIRPKGSSIIRKDVCEVSLYATMRVLKTILSNDSNKMASIHRLLKKIDRLVRTGNVPLTKYALHKQLTKDLDQYTSAKGQVHIQVALKLRKSGHILKAGDTVVYVICLTDDESNATMADKAIPITEAENKSCSIDYDWYLRHEILPSVTRLCESVMDTDGFAPCLGLEMEKKWSDRIREQQQQRLRHTKQLIQQEKDDFVAFKILDRKTDARPFMLLCQHCRNQVEIKGYTRYKKDEGWICGMQCQKCRRMMTTASISVQLVGAIRYYIKLYYQGWLCCQELDCDYRTRDCNMRCMNPCGCNGLLAREYSEDMLYSQLLYFDGLFDTSKDKSLKEDMDERGTSKQAIVDQYGQAYEILRKTVRKYLDRCGYRYVDISDYVDEYDDTE